MGASVRVGDRVSPSRSDLGDGETWLPLSAVGRVEVVRGGRCGFPVLVRWDGSGRLWSYARSDLRRA